MAARFLDCKQNNQCFSCIAESTELVEYDPKVIERFTLAQSVVHGESWLTPGGSLPAGWMARTRPAGWGRDVT
jgi:hypothetical protein